MRILSVGVFNGIHETCTHRNLALQEIGKVDTVNLQVGPVSNFYRFCNKLFNLGFPVSLPDDFSCNGEILKLVKQNKYDLLWIDKGLIINKSTLLKVRQIQPDIKIVSYSADNMVLRHNQSLNYLNCIPHYDYIFTNKSYILEELKQLGAKNVHFVNNAFELSFHYPRSLSNVEATKFSCDVGFIGHWEQDRCNSLIYLANNGIKVKVFGGGKWKNFKNISNLEILPPLFSDEYPTALSCFKISLCFLRKINGDQQTTRSVEIPACKGFMLAERTDEHIALFREGVDADYFSNDEELLFKCRYYLLNEKARKNIAESGYLKVHSLNLSNTKMIKSMVNLVFSNNLYL